MKVNFWVDGEDEIITLDDDMTEEDIEEEFQMWFNGCVSCGWTIVKEDQGGQKIWNLHTLLQLSLTNMI